MLSIVFGVIWTYGIFGLLGITLSPTTSGALAMIMGIGIDFGIQVVNRFKQELRRRKPEEAMKITVKRVFFPMLITVLAALIGFRAMSMGKLTVLGELGNAMSYGVLLCFLAAVTLVPSITLLSEKFARKLRKRGK